jgi:predicted nucleic acid-binding protein
LSLGLEVTGTVGLVLRASRRGVVDDPRATLVRLRAAGMWLSDSVLEGALATLEGTR